MVQSTGRSQRLQLLTMAKRRNREECNFALEVQTARMLDAAQAAAFGLDPVPKSGVRFVDDDPLAPYRYKNRIELDRFERSYEVWLASGCFAPTVSCVSLVLLCATYFQSRRRGCNPKAGPP